MAFFEARTFQLALGAVALTVAGFASAQAADAAAPAVAPVAAEAVKPAPKKAPKAGHHHHHKHGYNHGHKHRDHQRDGMASGREEAAANSEARRGRLDNGQGANQYERNAFARCQVFKTDIDRQACADRVKQGATSGSVEGGGVIRESVIQVPASQ